MVFGQHTFHTGFDGSRGGFRRFVGKGQGWQLTRISPALSGCENFVLTHHVAIASVFTLVVLVGLAVRTIISAPIDRDALFVRFVQVIFNAGALASASLAFALVLLLPAADWGRAKDFRYYVSVGALLAIVVALLQLLEVFGVLTDVPPAVGD